MIKRLVMKINAFEDGWNGPINEEHLCTDGVREYFDVPEGTEEILLCASDEPVRGATKAKIGSANCSCCRALCFEGKNPMIIDEMAAWFPEDTFWFWIEY